MEEEDEKKGELSTEEKIQQIIQRYNIDLKKLELEQEKLAKNIVLKDSIDFKLADRIAGIENVFVKNKIISAIVIISDGETIEQEYFEDKIRFPYIPDFRAYRELPTMISAFNKLSEKPDILFIHGSGIIHPRGLGIASHFSLVADVPAIGVADSIGIGEIKNEDVYIKDKIVGKVISTKEGANPIYVSPGSSISLKTAVELVKKFTLEPHKIPEPLRLARKYAKEVMKELSENQL